MKVEIVEDSTNSDDAIKFLKFANKINTSLENVSYKMVFNENECIFEVVKTMESDNDRYVKLATKLGGGRGVYYINMERELILQQASGFGETFLISSSLNDLEWEITKEEKVVNNKKVFKAILKTKKNSKSEKNTFAWFCPEIPSSFGPVGYGNLPGLILELHLDNGFVFYANKIIFGTDEMDIKAPSKGKKISREEFDKIGKEAIGKMKKG
jgi:GLPGLI family protein